ncbi:hypothetical protein BV22DRAFT_615147 [Leucogyrophana mollusca]|uniref:Uncharacterized protein n=1 Tax=Leucogyrophana mollusca TaxID=85980 RepID=A0ACB8BCR4_9AGAM|nr:hypothetical protein BV22DRAFT_615147 [Leucogyrophana mollusca]
MLEATGYHAVHPTLTSPSNYINSASGPTDTRVVNISLDWRGLLGRGASRASVIIDNSCACCRPLGNPVESILLPPKMWHGYSCMKVCRHHISSINAGCQNRNSTRTWLLTQAPLMFRGLIRNEWIEPRCLYVPFGSKLTATTERINNRTHGELGAIIPVRSSDMSAR